MEIGDQWSSLKSNFKVLLTKKFFLQKKIFCLQVGFLRAQRCYPHQNLRDASWDRLLLESLKIFVIPLQEPCFPAWDWIRNLHFGLKNGIFYSFELRQAIRMKTWENEVYACIFRKVAKFFVIPPHKPCFTAQNWIRNTLKCLNYPGRSTVESMKIWKCWHFKTRFSISDIGDLSKNSKVTIFGDDDILIKIPFIGHFCINI